MLAMDPMLLVSQTGTSRPMVCSCGSGFTGNVHSVGSLVGVFVLLVGSRYRQKMRGKNFRGEGGKHAIFAFGAQGTK